MGYTYIYTHISAVTYPRILNLVPNQYHHHHHYHHHYHIHFIACFSFSMVQLVYKSLSKTSYPLKNDSEGSVESIPSFFLSFTSTSSQVSLACPVSSVQLHLASIPQQSSLCCAQCIHNDLHLLVWRTTCRFWMPRFKRRESVLTLSLALTLKTHTPLHAYYAADGSV